MYWYNLLRPYSLKWDCFIITGESVCHQDSHTIVPVPGKLPKVYGRNWSLLKNITPPETVKHVHNCWNLRSLRECLDQRVGSWLQYQSFMPRSMPQLLRFCYQIHLLDKWLPFCQTHSQHCSGQWHHHIVPNSYIGWCNPVPNGSTDSLSDDWKHGVACKANVYINFEDD